MGAKIDALFLEAIELIVLASYSKPIDKHNLIVRASGKLDLVKFFLKLAWEMKLLDDKKYLAISTPLEETGKMLGGWLKQAERILNPKQNSFQRK